MTSQIQATHFTNTLLTLLDETFDNVHGHYLDKGVAEASIPVGGKCATVAAQVKHVAFYLDLVEKSVRTQQFEPVDWGKIWRETSGVTPEEWDSLKISLRESYDRIKLLVHDTPEWTTDELGGAIATLLHTAYHLGEIRQALCTLKQ